MIESFLTDFDISIERFHSSNHKSNSEQNLAFKKEKGWKAFSFL